MRRNEILEEQVETQLKGLVRLWDSLQVIPEDFFPLLERTVANLR
jgi:hypothetical protein